jgi:ribosomal protein L7/L12
MPTHTNQLPADVLDAIERGQAIEAINLLRQTTGLGLKDAKDVIDAHLRGDPVSLKFTAPPASAAAPGTLPDNVADALRRGDKVEAIKLLRLQTEGLELKDAKAMIEAFGASLRAGAASGLAPGEVPRSESGKWVLALLIFAVTATAWYFFR